MQILHHAKITAKEILDFLAETLGENRYPRDADLNDVIQQKLAAGISVHELFLREIDSLKKVEFRIADIRK